MYIIYIIYNNIITQTPNVNTKPAPNTNQPDTLKHITPQPSTPLVCAGSELLIGDLYK